MRRARRWDWRATRKYRRAGSVVKDKMFLWIYFGTKTSIMKKKWCLGTLNSCEKRKQTVSTQNSLPPCKEKRTLDEQRMQIPSYDHVWQLYRSVFFPCMEFECPWIASLPVKMDCRAFLWNLMRTANRINSTSPEGGPIRICFEDVMLACCKEIDCFVGEGKLQQGGSKQGERRNLYPFAFIASV